LHGLEGVPLTQSTTRAIRVFDGRCLRAMLCMRNKDTDTYVCFMRRQNKCVRRVLQKIGISELVVRVLSKQFGWAGHVTRLQPQHVAEQWARVSTIESWRISQSCGTILDASNATAWRHKKRGRCVRWETMLVTSLGDNWRAMPATETLGRRCGSTFCINLAMYYSVVWAPSAQFMLMQL